MYVYIHNTFKLIYIYIYCACGSPGKKLPKDEREGGTEKLSHHGAVPKEGPELVPKFGASSVFDKEHGLVFGTHIGRIFRTQKDACDSDIVCARPNAYCCWCAWNRWRHAILRGPGADRPDLA